MSFHTLVQDGLAGRLHLRRALTQRLEAQPLATVADDATGSMRGLEAIIALTAIATAILIGLGR